MFLQYNSCHQILLVWKHQHTKEHSNVENVFFLYTLLWFTLNSAHLPLKSMMVDAVIFISMQLNNCEENNLMFNVCVIWQNITKYTIPQERAQVAQIWAKYRLDEHMKWQAAFPSRCEEVIIRYRNIQCNAVEVIRTRSTRPIDAKLWKRLCLWIMSNIKISLYQTPPYQGSKIFQIYWNVYRWYI